MVVAPEALMVAPTEEEHNSQVVPGGKSALLYGMSLLDEEKGRYLIKSYEVAEFKKK